MVKGIGVDTTNISEITRLMQLKDNVFLNQTFTEREIEASKKAQKQMEYLAGRFAAKEAVFKATAHLLSEKKFDFRIVETLNEEDGYPYIVINSKMQNILNRIGVSNILVSITTESDFATAFVIVQDDK